MQLDGKTALVTGGGVRVGAAIARALARAGCDVVLHAFRSTDAAEALAGEIRGIRGTALYQSMFPSAPGGAPGNMHGTGQGGIPRRAVVIGGDLRSPEGAEKVAEDAEKAFGKIDILVNNAAAFMPTPVGTITEAGWRELIDLNLKAAYFLSDRLGSAMRKRGPRSRVEGSLRGEQGAIVNLADAAGIRPWPSYGVYCISKAGVIMMTRVLAKALAPDVRVNAIAPGPVLLPEGTSPEAAERAANATLLGRVGSPEDVARAVLFLVRDADYMTGQVVAVDGGRTA